MLATPLSAQDGEGGGSEYIVVTGSRIKASIPPVTTQLPYLDKRPVIGLRRGADGAVRSIEIGSDSRDEDMRRSEVEAMMLAALDRAKREGLSLVTGELEVTEVTRENWRNLFPGLAGAPASDEDDDDDDYDDDDDDSGKVRPGYEDDGSTATLRLLVKTRLTGSIADAQRKIAGFVKAVPATGRSEIRQKGDLALTIVNPEQYRDEIYRRIAAGVQRAVSFYGADYGAEISGLNREIAWAQVSNTEVFLYIPYGFDVRK
ncbi:MAG: hypothetical protein ACREBO_05240 [Novosphingobium sp.]